MKTATAGRLALASLALLAVTGCATPEQWSEWRSHSSHFASGQHALFSVRNPGPEAQRVKTTDVPKAREQSWWGRQVTVAGSEGGS
jgi:hypothetical protein